MHLMDTLFNILLKLLKVFIRTGSPTEPLGRPLDTSFQEDMNQQVSLPHNPAHYSCDIGDFFPGAMLKVGVDLNGGLL